MFLTDPSQSELAELYATRTSPSNRPFVRVNFVVTVDGHVTGRDGLSGSINNDADGVVFELLRGLADVVMVGAGTAREEGYGRLAQDLVVVSNSGVMPDSVVERSGEGPWGAAILATCDGATAPADGPYEVLECGEGAVDLGVLLGRLGERGVRSVLCEGGPHLLTNLLQDGLVDEIAITTSPMLVGAVSGKMLTTAPLDVEVTWRGGAVLDGTIFALWSVT